MWKTFKGCICLKQILIASGYDNHHSLICMDEEKLNELEEKTDFNQKFDCSHLKIYNEQKKFKLLLGHRYLILKFCQDLSMVDKSNSEVRIDHPAFSPIMIEMIRSALTNYQKTPNTRRFSNLLMDFSICLYIMAGKACYEMVSGNLPIPKPITICKCS